MKKKKWQKNLGLVIVVAILVWGAQNFLGIDLLEVVEENSHEVKVAEGETQNSSEIASINNSTKTATEATTSVTRPEVTKEINENWEEVIVTRVVDGDTIELSDKRKVRYIGVDTPETKDPRRPVGCFGAEASEFNRELVESKTIWLEKDTSETDRYGRLLRYLYVWNEELEEFQMVQESLLKGGFAQASRYVPDVKYAEHFAELQKEATANQVGLWAEDACADFEAGN